MPELLLEIGCEELPASACREALRQAPRLVGETCERLGIGAAVPQALVAPRRIAVLADVPAERPAATTTHVGPTERAAFGEGGEPTRAAEGFARSRGVDTSDLLVEERDGRRVVTATVSESAVSTADLVPEVARSLLEGLRFGKSMRWGAGTGLRFARPVRWLVAMLDEQHVPFELHGLLAGPETRGHRFLGRPLRLGHASGYLDALRAQGVVADQEERRAGIVAGLDEAARGLGGAWRDPGRKLEEVLYLAEWPNVITGAFRETHLRLPARVLVTAMQSHQRYFPLENPDGTLRSAFLAVSNGDPAHAPLIARGNEDVLDARLQDAAFSFDRDRETGLETLDERLDAIVFHARLGSMADKRDRIVQLTRDVARAAGLDDVTVGHAADAARLAKADQAATLVDEFAELEGFVGAEYARLEGAPDTVWRAIGEQYLPTGVGTDLPATDAGAALAVADKLDSVIGAFLAGEGPTGSRDPYGVRRSAAGIIRIVLAREWDVDLDPIATRAVELLLDQGADATATREEVEQSVGRFLADRLAFQLREEGVGAEATGAAIGAKIGGPRATASWARQIQLHRDDASFRACWTAAERSGRLAGDAEPLREGADVDDPAEAALGDAIAVAAPKIGAAREGRDLTDAVAAGAPLAEAIDRFLTDVLVNAEDPDVRARRLGLVRSAALTLAGVADFAQLTDGGR